jgi:hypothetical protein
MVFVTISALKWSCKQWSKWLSIGRGSYKNFLNMGFFDDWHSSTHLASSSTVARPGVDFYETVSAEIYG